jgi:hypothetical protein
MACLPAMFLVVYGVESWGDYLLRFFMPTPAEM